MTEREQKETKTTSHIASESVKVYAETVGVAGLAENAAAHLADDLTFRLKQTIQVV